MDLIRWNAGFVRGLAQSVLDRARVIRMSLEQATGRKPLKKAAAKKVASAKKPRKTKKVKKANA